MREADTKLTIGLYPCCIASSAVALTHPLVLTPTMTTVSTPSLASSEASVVPKNPLAYFLRITLSPLACSGRRRRDRKSPSSLTSPTASSSSSSIHPPSPLSSPALNTSSAFALEKNNPASRIPPSRSYSTAVHITGTPVPAEPPPRAAASTRRIERRTSPALLLLLSFVLRDEHVRSRGDPDAQ